MSIQTAEPQRTDWKWVTLADVAKVVTGNTPPTADAKNYGDAIPFVKPTELVDRGIRFAPAGLADQALSKARVVPAGAVLVSCIGNLGKTGLAKVAVAFNQQINAVVFNESVIPEFGFYYAQTLKSWLYGESSATTLPIVNKGKFQQAPFPLAPLDEQREIVAEIEKQFSRLDEAVANLKRVTANLKRYKASVLKDAVEGRLVPTEAELARREGRSFETGEQLLQRVLHVRRCNWVGKGAYKQPDWSAGVRPTPLPDGWASCGVDHVLPASKDALKTGPFGSLLKKHEHRESGVAVLGIENISAMRFIKGSKIAISEEKAAELREYDARPRDVLVSRSGTVGEVCVVPDDIGHARISTNLLRVRLASGGMLPEFFVLLFNGSPFVLRQVSELCKGSTRDFLNQAILKKLCFALPPLHEQRRILNEVDRCLSLFHEIESEVDRNLMRAQALRQATLHSAFPHDTYRRPQ